MRKPWFRDFNKCWYVTINRRKINLGKDKKAAFRRWHEMEEAGLEGFDLPLEEAVQLYLDSLSGCSAETRDVAKRHLDDFSEHVGKLKCSRLRAHHWTSFLRTKAWAPSTARTALNKINACLNHAVEQGKLDAHKFKVPKKEIPRFERRKVVVTAEEQVRMEAAAPPAFRDFLIGLRLSGCRPGEIASARIENVKDGMLFVRNKTAHSTGEAYRPVYLTAELSELIRQLSEGRTEGLIWRNAEKGQWKRMALVPAMRRLRVKLKLRKGITLYTYRSRFVTSALEKGIDAISVSELVGHRTLDMVKKHYASLGKDHLRKAAEKAAKTEGQ